MHLPICLKCKNRRLQLQQGQLLDVMDNNVRFEEDDILCIVPVEGNHGLLAGLFQLATIHE
jgi:hypothetical protein